MRRALLVLLLAFTGLFTGAGDASAVGIGTDCLKPPIPASPVHPFDAGPVNPREGDPFGANPTSTIYEVYGYGPGPIQYDPGCNPVQLSWSPVAGWFHAQAVNLLAGAASLWRTATDGTVSRVFDPMQQAVARMWTASAPGNPVTVIAALLSISLIASGLWYVMFAWREKLRDTTRSSLVAVVVIATGVVALFYPLVVGPAVDSALGNTVTAVNTALGPVASAGDAPRDATTGDAVAVNTVQSVVYPSWREETFGPENRAAADEFGPRLWAEATLTRAEQKQVDADPASAKALVDAKQSRFKEAAREIEQKYPRAYQHLAGNQSLNQVSVAGLAWFASLLTVGFLLYGLGRAVYGLVIVRVVIAVAPAVAVIGQHPLGQPVFWRVLSWVWGALLTGVTAAVAAVLYLIVGVGGILGVGNDLPVLIKAGLLLLLTLAAARFLHLGNKGLKQRLREGAERHRDRAGDRSHPARDSAPQDRVTRAQAAVQGARQGVTTAVVAGAVTGGAVTAGAVSRGAVRGAITAGATTTSTPGHHERVPVYRVTERTPTNGHTSRAALPGRRSLPGPGPRPEPSRPSAPVSGRVYTRGETNPSTGLTPRRPVRTATGRVYQVTSERTSQ